MPEPINFCPCGRLSMRVPTEMVVLCAACKGWVAPVPPSAEVAEKERTSG